MKMKWIILLFALLPVASACSTGNQQPTVASKPAIDQAKFETLYRSAKNIQGALTVGASYQRFGELLQGLATEVSIAGDKATSSKEMELVGPYTEAFKTYQDSLSLWTLKVQNNLTFISYPGYTFQADLLVKKYSIPIRGERLKYLDLNAVQIIWAVAEAQLEKANKLYYSQEPVPK